MRRVILAVLLLVAVGMPTVAHADTNDFTVTSFSADETLTRNDPQGSLRIVETIDVNFTDNNHGILRALPKSYQGHPLNIHINKVSSPSNAPAEYKKSTSNGNEVLKIGSPDSTVTGPQKYVIDYTVENVISFRNGKQALLWNVNGDQWSQQFGLASVVLHLPEGAGLAEQPHCYTGVYGSSRSACSVARNAQTVRIQTVQGLKPHETLTYNASFVGSYFTPESTIEKVWDIARPIVAGLLPFLLLVSGSFAYWWRNGRDPKGSRVTIAQYDAPANITPLEAGSLLRFTTDTKDVTATIIDLAIRKYIRIIETKEARKLRSDKLSYSLELTNPDYTGLLTHEQTLLTALFKEQKVGAHVELNDKSLKLYETVASLKTEAKNRLVLQGYLAKNRLGSATRAKATFLAMLVIVVGACLVLSAAACVIGLVLGFVISLCILAFIDARTANGVTAKEHLEGLKLYLSVAEKDRIKALQSPDAPLARNANEPVKTVELFEKLLPYAIVLGVEEEWGEQFKDIYKAQPDWYHGANAGFNSLYLAGALNSGISDTVATAFTAPSSGGGGFAGGGGGGGGGGGW